MSYFLKLRQRIPTPASLITGSGRCIQLIDDFLPQTRLIFPTPPPEKAFYTPCVAKFSPHNFLRIAAGGENGRLSFIRGDLALKSEEDFIPINTMTVADNIIFDLVFLENDKTTICIGSGDQSVRFIDSTNSKVISTHFHQKGSPQVLSCFNDGVLSGDRDGQVCFWDSKNGQDPSFSFFMKNSASVYSIVSPTDDLFITGDSQGRILAWDPRNLKSPFHIPVQKPENNTKNNIVNLAISPNGKMMSSLSSNDTLNIYSLDGEWRYYSFHWPKIGGFFTRASFSPDSRYIVTGSETGTVYCFSIVPNKPPVPLLGHLGPATCVEWCRNLFDVIISCSDDKTLQFWVADHKLAKDDEPEISPFIPGADAGAFDSYHEKQPTVTKVYTLHHFL